MTTEELAKRVDALEAEQEKQAARLRRFAARLAALRRYVKSLGEADMEDE